MLILIHVLLGNTNISIIMLIIIIHELIGNTNTSTIMLIIIYVLISNSNNTNKAYFSVILRPWRYLQGLQITLK